MSIVAIAVAVACMAGCASSTPQAASGPPANVAGSWSGATVGSSGAFVSMQLTQTGAAVAGNIEIGGRSDLSGPPNGTVGGSELNPQRK